MIVRFHPAAREELLSAYRWYEERSPVAAAAFVREIDTAIRRIAEGPLRYPSAEHDTRRIVIHRYPFSLFFRVDRGQITVIAVAHHKRRPGYWSGRSTSGSSAS